eukprot:CAMPEP_0172462616 /NCGR_PEP_ID=MMETSP1065-20121228/44354_1 /TAXON_ID=265537 /ORGANISM="Amphiprora paludosa, Strain CCMP125" /LENGTH=50 /DNA_ID=CAMNT_0013218329 /DNA_START=6 /DNA_END=161 /DNA_ORIENTATION=-
MGKDIMETAPTVPLTTAPETKQEDGYKEAPVRKLDRDKWKIMPRKLHEKT